MILKYRIIYEFSDEEDVMRTKLINILIEDLVDESYSENCDKNTASAKDNIFFRLMKIINNFLNR